MTNSGSYSWLDIDSAPREPGLYAWYLNIKFGRADIEVPDEWRRQLELFAQQHKRPVLQVNLKAPLGLEFIGEAKHIVYDTMKNESLATATAQEIQVISDILKQSIPLISSPLYIGIATRSLRSRLKSHKRLINKHREDQNIVPSDYSNEADFEQQEADNTFAARVVERNIDVNHLVVYILSLQDRLEEPSSKVEKVLQKAEFLLNRFYQPLLGRR
jgi:hypothetical protein